VPPVNPLIVSEVEVVDPEPTTLRILSSVATWTLNVPFVTALKRKVTDSSDEVVETVGGSSFACAKPIIVRLHQNRNIFAASFKIGMRSGDRKKLP
jgi:hypothetical protein